MYHVIYRFRKGVNPDFKNGACIVAVTGEDSYTENSNLEHEFIYYVSSLDRLYNESKPVKAKAR